MHEKDPLYSTVVDVVVALGNTLFCTLLYTVFLKINNLSSVGHNSQQKRHHAVFTNSASTSPVMPFSKTFVCLRSGPTGTHQTVVPVVKS